MSAPLSGCSSLRTLSVLLCLSASASVSTCSAFSDLSSRLVRIGLARSSPASSVKERIERTCSLSRRSHRYVLTPVSLSPKISQKPTLPCLLASSARPTSSRSESLISPLPERTLSVVRTVLRFSTPASIMASLDRFVFQVSVVVSSESWNASHWMN